jgi:LCP family protein required for cell wall assembly
MRKKWFLRVFAIILLFILGVGVYSGTQIWAAIANSSKPFAQSQLRTKQVKMNDPFTILFIGSDQDGKDPIWQSDAMILVAVNPKTKSMKVLSIPRDLYVTIPNTNGMKGKIDWSGSYGLKTVGVFENFRQAVENLMQVPVDYYVKLNFEGFQNVVDALGGVDVNVKFPFHQEMLGGKMAYFKPGKHHLNGAEALAYVRMRKQDPNGDLGRTDRQREVLTALFDKLASFNGIYNFDKVMKAVGDNLEMSFKPSDIPTLIDLYRQIPKKNIETIKMKVSFARIPNVGDVDILDQQEKERIRKIFQDELNYHPKTTQTQGDQTDISGNGISSEGRGSGSN